MARKIESIRIEWIQWRRGIQWKSIDLRRPGTAFYVLQCPCPAVVKCREKKKKRSVTTVTWTFTLIIVQFYCVPCRRLSFRYEYVFGKTMIEISRRKTFTDRRVGRCSVRRARPRKSTRLIARSKTSRASISLIIICRIPMLFGAVWTGKTHDLYAGRPARRFEQ